MALPELQKLNRLRFPMPAALPTPAMVDLNINLYAQAVGLKPTTSTSQLAAILYEALEVLYIQLLKSWDFPHNCVLTIMSLFSHILEMYYRVKFLMITNRYSIKKYLENILFKYYFRDF